MTRARWRRPGILSTLPFVLMIAMFLVAAHWQWQRAMFKEARAKQFESALQADTVRSLVSALADPRPAGERVRLRGSLDRERIVLLDNRIREGQYGVDVYAPLRTDGGQSILVGIGWVAADRSRQLAPALPPLPEQLDSIALLTDPPASGLRLGADSIADNATYPLLLSRIDIAALRKRFALAELPDRVAELAPDGKSGFVRDWQLPGLGADRHRGYALQWLSFAIGTLVFFILWHRPRKGSAR